MVVYGSKPVIKFVRKALGGGESDRMRGKMYNKKMCVFKNMRCLIL